MLRHAGTLAIVVLTAFGMPTAPTFKPGEKVDSRFRPDPVCDSRADVERYSTAINNCDLGIDDACAEARRLEKAKVCGFNYKIYVVGSVETDSLMRISPVTDRSKFVWGDPHDFWLFIER